MACSSKSSSRSPERVRFWHAFNSDETAALTRSLAAWRPAARVSVEPVGETFARGQIMLRQILEAGQNCPDLARVDATWLPGLASAGLLSPAPAAVVEQRRWLPGAAQLASLGGIQYGAPQSIDGLALIYRRAPIEAAGIAWPPATADELVAAARQLTGEGRYGLGLRVDGYWFVAFLDQWGGRILAPESGELGIDTPASAAALTRFAGLFGDIVPPLPPSGAAAEDEVRRFKAGTLPIVVNGPWALAELTGGDTEGIAVAPLPGAPLGGQILVVPRCAGSPGPAWKLAGYLTSPEVQREWSSALGVIPTTIDGLRGTSAFTRAFYDALRSARPLPRHPVTPEIFDDFTPAIAAVVAGDATAADALAPVARAWSALLERHGVTPRPHRRDGGPGR